MAILSILKFRFRTLPGGQDESDVHRGFLNNRHGFETGGKLKNAGH